jgi:hypothetical protein
LSEREFALLLLLPLLLLFLARLFSGLIEYEEGKREEKNFFIFDGFVSVCEVVVVVAGALTDCCVYVFVRVRVYTKTKRQN